MNRSLLAFAIVLLVTTPLYADYHYASHTGNNTYPYTSWETAADSIQLAVNAAIPGDTVFIGSGEYHQRTEIDTDRLAIIGMGWDSTFVWWDVDRDPVFEMAANRYYSVYFEGLHIRHLNYKGIGDGIRNNYHINLCKFSNPQNPTDMTAVGVGVDPDSNIIENCIFDSLAYGVDNFASGTRFVVRNCLFRHVRSAMTPVGVSRIELENNIMAYVFPYVPVSNMGGSDSVFARNNLLYGVRQAYSLGVEHYVSFQNHTTYFNDTIAGPFSAVCPTKVVVNNSITNAYLAAYQGPGESLYFAYNQIWNAIPPPETAEGNITAYPMFLNLDSGDFHLQAYSPLIDAGDPSILDVDGTRSDIGVFGGPLGRSYPYLDLAPRAPDSLAYKVSGDTVYLFWRQNHEADFWGYRLHRDEVPGFTPSIFNQIAEPESAFYADGGVIYGGTYYYRVASLDGQGNLSAYSPELSVSVTGLFGEGGALMPGLTTIETSYPNPFNSSTKIVYFVANLGPIPAQISIDIYDVQGRKVRSLLDERKEVGRHEIIWDGRDDLGNELSSGIYFARICQWNTDYLSGSRKLLLVR